MLVSHSRSPLSSTSLTPSIIVFRSVEIIVLEIYEPLQCLVQRATTAKLIRAHGRELAISLLAEFRHHERQAAKELGQRGQKVRRARHGALSDRER
jgi:hypothetical protein